MEQVLAQVRRAFDMMCERAVSRQTRHGTLASLGVVAYVAAKVPALRRLEKLA